ncbi:MAG: hypothetical protein JSV32_02845 [Dehalococcoidia bacterium]|nr:MAG: hypothetical protein JSV32_02845 [Dehalococcoidia bacterium]
MTDNWKEDYQKLIELISKNSEISIDKERIDIPDRIRQDFWQLFDNIQLSYLKENHRPLLDMAKVLSTNYTQSLSRVMEMLDLKEVILPPMLSSFLDNPQVEMLGWTYDPLYSLIIGEDDIAKFQEECSGKVRSLFRYLHQEGYRNWLTLALIEILTPHKIYTTPIVDLNREPQLTELDIGGIHTEFVSNPTEARHISFDHDGSLPPFAVADIIVQHNENRYFAIRTKIQRGLWRAQSHNENKEWYNWDNIRCNYDIDKLTPVIALYIDKEPESLKLISDFTNVCRPDLLIQCVDEPDLYKDEQTQNSCLYHKMLKPVFGSSIVCNTKPSEKLSHEIIEILTEHEISEGVVIIYPGYNREDLLPLLNHLKQE